MSNISHFEIKGGKLMSYRGPGGKVTIPSTVTSISEYAYFGGRKITEITIPGTVKSIPMQCFDKCKSIRSVTLMPGVTSIGRYAFNECTALKKLVIPSTLTRISPYAFLNCSSIEEVHITDLKAWCEIDRNIEGHQSCLEPNNLYLNGELLRDVVIPDGVKEITPWTFANCTSIETVTVPDTTKIGYNAFYKCTNLCRCNIPLCQTELNSPFDHTAIESFEVHDGVTALINSLFECKSLKTASLGQGITTLPTAYFCGCESLKEIHITKSMQYIGSHPFIGCSSLEVIYYYGTVEEWKAIEKCPDWLKINYDNQTNGTQLKIVCTDGVIYTEKANGEQAD
ncbi:MAG: leucine-rich repeat domain-containing protein [Clostridia bacterium]|nr:leucine-rich repeat domain-containing protein [Clostridia bacterium]